MWVIITRNQCNFCDSAKALLKGHRLDYITYNVQDSSSKWLLSLLKAGNITTVPQIFTNKGEHIGGYTDLVEHLKES